MSDEFLITEERLNKIAESFKTNIETVRLIHRDFSIIEDQIKGQRLAHISRVLEEDMKERTGNPRFIIKYIPYKIRTSRMRGSMSTRSSDCFKIFFDNTLTEKDIRVNISHELGHLYLSERYKMSEEPKADLSKKVEVTTEPLSSIFGLFVISNKNHFYANLDPEGHRHTDWDSILKDFKNL